MPRIGVILAGCGYLDGAEIREAVVTLLALSRKGAEAACFAPDVAQKRVVDHISGEEVEETRNVLIEAARIARGEIADVRTASIDGLDAVILPGGFGAAFNLSTFALEGAGASIDEGVAGLLRAAHDAGKPVGAICIAPAVVALALGDKAPNLTIGNDAGTAEALQACGAHHTDCAVTEINVDEENRIVSTPAYMYDAPLADVATGIESLVDRVLSMV